MILTTLVIDSEKIYFSRVLGSFFFKFRYIIFFEDICHWELVSWSYSGLSNFENWFLSYGIPLGHKTSVFYYQLRNLFACKFYTDNFPVSDLDIFLHYWSFNQQHQKATWGWNLANVSVIVITNSVVEITGCMLTCKTAEIIEVQSICRILEKIRLWRTVSFWRKCISGDCSIWPKNKIKSCMLDPWTPITVLSVPVTYPKAAICSYSTTY